MGHQFTIESDEAFAAMQELATLTGTSLEGAVMAAVQERLDKERKHRVELARLPALTATFTKTLGHPLPTPEHSFLYDDETGLPA